MPLDAARTSAKTASITEAFAAIDSTTYAQAAASIILNPMNLKEKSNESFHGSTAAR